MRQVGQIYRTAPLRPRGAAAPRASSSSAGPGREVRAQAGRAPIVGNEGEEEKTEGESMAKNLFDALVGRLPQHCQQVDILGLIEIDLRR